MIRVALATVAAVLFAAVWIWIGTDVAAGARYASPAHHVNRSALFYQAAACFHVAPRQWVCPEPAP